MPPKIKAIETVGNSVTQGRLLMAYLDRLRVSQGLSQEQLCRKAGYSVGAWYSAVSGRNSPKMDMFCTFAEALGYSTLLMEVSKK